MLSSIQTKLPRAREDGLVVQLLRNEVLVRDLNQDKTYSLNKPADSVWRHCDGVTTIEEMLRVLRRDFGAQVHEDVVWSALEQLSQALLLDASFAASKLRKKLSERRELGRPSWIPEDIPEVTPEVKPAVAQVSAQWIEAPKPSALEVVASARVVTHTTPDDSEETEPLAAHYAPRVDKAKTGQRTYPLEKRLLRAGLLSGIIVGSILLSPVMGVSVLVLFAASGLLWHRAHPPALVFCLAYQWAFIVIGYGYDHLTGRFPAMPLWDLRGYKGFYQYGSLDLAVILSLGGLIALAYGIRTGLYTFSKWQLPGDDAKEVRRPRYNIGRLFKVVVVLYSIHWLIEVSHTSLPLRVSQIIQNLLMFREVFLVLLFLIILRSRAGYGYGAAALAWALIPRFASVMSNFKELLFYIVIALLADPRLYSRLKSDAQYRSRILKSMACMVLVLVALGVIWEGGVKPNWRPAVVAGDVAGSPLEKVGSFIGMGHQALRTLDPFSAFEALVARMSSGIGYFSLVLDRVPDVVPHEDGALTARVFNHILKPRFLFPDKPSLGSNSWLIHRYAGIKGAGEEEGTSLGLSYMAQFYIDFGFLGMFPCIFGLGVVLGAIYGALFKFSPAPILAMSAVTVIFIQHFISYDGEIAYIIGGILQSFVIFALLIHWGGAWFLRFISDGPSSTTTQPSSVAIH